MKKKNKKQKFKVLSADDDDDGINIFKRGSYFDIKFLYKKYLLKFKKDIIFMINMELRNGMHITTIVKASSSNFKFRGGSYIIDNEFKYFNISSHLWCLDYHQDISLPIKRVIPVNCIKKALSTPGITEVENSINPKTLEIFITSKIAEGVMKGQELSEKFKQLLLIIIIGTCASVMHLLIFVIKSGMLKSIKIPGIN